MISIDNIILDFHTSVASEINNGVFKRQLKIIIKENLVDMSLEALKNEDF